MARYDGQRAVGAELQPHKSEQQDLQNFSCCLDRMRTRGRSRIASRDFGKFYRSSIVRQHKWILTVAILVWCCNSMEPTICTPTASSFGFNGNFLQQNFTTLGDASLSSEQIELNMNGAYQSQESSGRAIYSQPVQFWDPNNNSVVSFQTAFSFNIFARNLATKGDGLAFGIFPDSSSVGSSGKYMGLFPEPSGTGPSPAPSTSELNAPSSLQSISGFNGTFAVEFDTHQNLDFDDPSDNHVGVNWNNMTSLNATDLGPLNISLVGWNLTAWIEYYYPDRKLSVWITTGHLSTTPQPSTPVLEVADLDLSQLLLPSMYVGFAGGIGSWNELHSITSWSFDASFNDSLTLTGKSSPTQPSPIAPGKRCEGISCSKRIIVIVSSVFLSCVVAVAIVAVIIFFIRRRRRKHREDFIREKFKSTPRPSPTQEPRRLSSATDNLRFKRNGFASPIITGSRRFTNLQELDAVSSFGPRRYTYRELKLATNSFKETLGRGGFGSVFKGHLPNDKSIPVAVKQVADDSKQGEREFLAEVSIIARLRHRNLVRMLGWCHEKGRLLLVYDYMQNGSLDRHLHEPRPGEPVLSWDLRYNAVCQVGSALAYLHEEAEEKVIHRDVKASNVLLDANFKARLGDFGLARLSDHSQMADTTVLAGTLGYLAPELLQTGKATTKSDVFSFGALILEVMCGLRPLDDNRPDKQMILCDWVWARYEEGQLLDVVDPRLAEEYDEKIMTWTLQVGLMCLHPDPMTRPSIRFAQQILQGDCAPPPLPRHKPTQSFGSGAVRLSMDDLLFSSTAIGTPLRSTKRSPKSSLKLSVSDNPESEDSDDDKCSRSRSSCTGCVHSGGFYELHRGR